MFTDSLLVFDHLQHKIKVVSHFRLDGDVEAAYRQAAWRIEELVGRLEKPLDKLPYRDAPGVPAESGRRTSRDDRSPDARSSARRSTSSRATSSRSCCRSASSVRPRRTRSTSTAPCARSTRRPTCTTSTWARLSSSARRRRCWCGSRTARSTTTRSPARGAAASTPPKTPRWRSTCSTTRRSAPSTSCCSTSAATTSAASASRAPSRCDADHGRRALLARHAPRLARHGAAARRPVVLRRAAGLLPGRHRLRRAEDPRDGDHRRAGAGPARPLRRRRRLLRPVGQPRHGDHDPHDR